MAFSREVVNTALAAVSRRCVVCKKQHQVQVHHIVSLEDGGSDELENALVLCPLCHDIAHMRYTPGRITRSYTEGELEKHREETIQQVESHVERFSFDKLPEQRIKDNLAMRKLLMKSLLLPPGERDNRDREPYSKFLYTDLVVRSIDDPTYPDVDEERPGISPWFKAECWDFYYDGLQLLLNVRPGVRFADGTWAFNNTALQHTKDGAKYFKIYLIGDIPYDNIVDLNLDGDEIYQEPHLFCRFNGDKGPYSEEYSFSLEQDFYGPLLEDTEIIYDE